MGKSVEGKTINIWAPSAIGLLKAMASITKTIWSLKFKCGSCGAKPIVQHDEDKNYHKCPVCGTINILEETSYYDLYE